MHHAPMETPSPLPVRPRRRNGRVCQLGQAKDPHGRDRIRRLSMLKRSSVPPVREYAREVIREVLERDKNAWRNILLSIADDQFALCDNRGSLAELYYLPLRLTKILGWIGLDVMLEYLLPELGDRKKQFLFELCSRIVDRYEFSLVAVSDEQAPFLYLFLKACVISNQNELAQRVANLYFGSFAAKGGNIARVNANGEAAFHYVRSLGPTAARPTDWQPASPSSLLSVLLLYGRHLALDGVWDLRAIDRRFALFFIPQDYLDFGNKVIERGMNYTCQMGFGTWSLSDFKKEFDRGMKEGFPQKTMTLHKEELAVCALASLLFPDRLPLFLEQIH